MQAYCLYFVSENRNSMQPFLLYVVSKNCVQASLLFVCCVWKLFSMQVYWMCGVSGNINCLQSYHQYCVSKNLNCVQTYLLYVVLENHICVQACLLCGVSENHNFVQAYLLYVLSENHNCVSTSCVLCLKILIFCYILFALYYSTEYEWDQLFEEFYLIPYNVPKCSHYLSCYYQHELLFHSKNPTLFKKKKENKIYFY